MKKEKQTQPAVKSYFFGEGYSDLLCTIKDTFKSVVDRGLWWFRGNQQSPISKLWAPRPINEDGSKGGIPGFFKVLIMIPLLPFSIGAMLSIFVFGTLTALILSIYHIIILLILMIVVYIAFSFVWVADRIYLKVKKISSVCPDCKNKMLIPTYQCECGALHTRLTPGVYGILFRKCKCGKRLPATFLTGRGKKNMTAICPNCGKTLSGDRARPICIPVIGGSSAGKTAFINAFSYNFVENLAHQKNWIIQDYNDEKHRAYDNLVANYKSGVTMKTAIEQDLSKASSVSVSFIVGGNDLKPDRTVHIYDIAGETFTASTENEIQKQYEYCHGIVIMIDPFSIPEVYNEYADQLLDTDSSTASPISPDTVVDGFINKLHDLTGLTDKEAMNTPVAVVINKIDAVDLNKVIGTEGIHILKKLNPDKYKNDMDNEDFLCRKFLREYGMENLLNIVDLKFPNNRYFSCSSLGHTAGSGPCQPIGVMEPMQWLFGQEDSDMKKLWCDTEFTNTPEFKK